MSERILEAFRPSGFSADGQIIYHGYLVYEDRAGAVHFMSGKPTTAVGSDLQILTYTLNPSRVVYDEGYYKTPGLPRKIIFEGDDLRARWEIGKDHAATINLLPIPYLGPVSNSNSAVYSLIVAMGGTPANLVDDFDPNIVALGYGPLGLEPSGSSIPAIPTGRCSRCSSPRRTAPQS